jgi:TolB-like protein
MKYLVRTILATLTMFCFLLPNSLSAQKRVVVLPFKNMAGEVALNPWRFELADSLRTALLGIDPEQKSFMMVDQDSVELAISDLNLDPNNAQYESDVWRAVKNLHADLAVSGNFLLRGDRVLMNAYVYDVEYQIANQEHQAKNLYKTPTTYLEAVAVMAKKLHPALIAP